MGSSNALIFDEIMCSLMFSLDFNFSAAIRIGLLLSRMLLSLFLFSVMGVTCSMIGQILYMKQ